MSPSHGLPRVLGTLLLVLGAIPSATSSEAPPSAFKQDPRSAQRSAAAKRAPQGKRGARRAMANMAVSALASKPGTPNTLLAGTGEGFFNEDLVRGAGIFQTINGGTTWTQTVAVKRTGTLTQVSTVAYQIAGGTAAAGVDHNPFPPAALSGTLTFASGVASINLVIDIVADLLDEPNKTFQLSLSSPTAAKLGANVIATATITDNDLP